MLNFYYRSKEIVGVRIRNNSRDLLAILFLVLVTVFTRLPFMNWPLISDEGGYAYTSIRWFRGLTLYSDQLWFDRPQAIFLIYKLGLSLFGNETWAIRFWGSLWAAGTAVFVFFIGYRLGNLTTALLAGGIFVLYSGLPFIEGFTANAEVFAAFFSVACVFFLLEGRTGLAGLLGSVAFLTKPAEVSILIFALIWIAMNHRSWRTLLAFFGGAIIIPVISLIHGILSVGFNDYLYAIVLFRLSFRDKLDLLSQLNNILHTLPVWAPLCLLTVFSAKYLNRDRSKFIFLWLFSALFGMAIGGNWWRHYFTQVIPPLAVGAAFGIRYLSGKKIAGKIVTSVIFIIPVIVYSIFAIIPPNIGSWLLYRRKGYQIADRVATYLRSNTAADETIYIAFAEADIYWLADRRSSYPHIYRLEVQHIPGAYDRIIKMIEEKVPTYILALDSPVVVNKTTESLMTPLNENYHIVNTFDGIPLYKRDE